MSEFYIIIARDIFPNFRGHVPPCLLLPTPDCQAVIRRFHTGVRTDTKVQFYMTYIHPILLYGRETWTVDRPSGL